MCFFFIILILGIVLYRKISIELIKTVATTTTVPVIPDNSGGFCVDCKRKMYLYVDAKSVAMGSAIIGRERMTILYSCGLLGTISEVEFQRLKARLWRYDKYGY